MIYQIDGVTYLIEATSVFYGRTVTYTVTTLATGELVGKAQLDEPQEYWCLIGPKGEDWGQVNASAFQNDLEVAGFAVAALVSSYEA